MKPARLSGSKGNTVIVVLVIVAIIVALGFFYAYRKSHNLSFNTTPTATTTASSQTIPTQVTKQDAPQVLDQTGNAIEADMGQLNQDMETLNQNDPNQDNPSNLNL